MLAVTRVLCVYIVWTHARGTSIITFNCHHQIHLHSGVSISTSLEDEWGARIIQKHTHVDGRSMRTYSGNKITWQKVQSVLSCVLFGVDIQTKKKKQNKRCRIISLLFILTLLHLCRMRVSHRVVCLSVCIYHWQQFNILQTLPSIMYTTGRASFASG